MGRPARKFHMHPLREELHYGSRVVKTFADRPASVDAMFRQAVAAGPAEIAVVAGDERTSYGQLDELVDRIVANLLRRGLVGGDRVAVILGNRLAFVALYLACARASVVIVPIGTRLTRIEARYICEHSGAALLVCEPAYEASAPDPADLPGLREVIRLDERGGFADLPPSGPPVVPEPPGEEDLLSICYTSGTTGRPKGAMVTHMSAVHGALNWLRGVGAGPRETMILAIPAAHIGGSIGVVLASIANAGKLVLMPEFKAKDFLDLAERERLTFFVGVPAIYNLLLLDPSLGGRDLSSWRYGVFSAAPMPDATVRKLAAALPNLTLINAYGATETTTAISIMPPGQALAHAGSVGTAVPVGQVVIMDDNCQEAERGVPGEIWIAGPMVVSGYWDDPAATAASFPGGYWRSGDVGMLDEDGYLHILDRKKDMIIRGGLKIFAAEVECALCEHSDVLEAAVVGVPDPVLGERVHAFVFTQGAATGQAIAAFCKTIVADYKAPERIIVDTQPLPRNANGKLMKALLRERAMAAVAAG